MEQNGKYGVIDKSGNIVIDADYEAVQIPNPSKDIFICIKEYNQDTKEYATVVYNGKKEEISEAKMKEESIVMAVSRS